jgi:hypothetical protein
MYRSARNNAGAARRAILAVKPICFLEGFRANDIGILYRCRSSFYEQLPLFLSRGPSRVTRELGMSFQLSSISEASGSDRGRRKTGRPRHQGRRKLPVLCGCSAPVLMLGYSLKMSLVVTIMVARSWSRLRVVSECHRFGHCNRVPGLGRRAAYASLKGYVGE